MSTVTLTGARWSDAVRCIARATYQGLGTEPSDEHPSWLEGAFDRGMHVGEMWGLIQAKRLEAQGHEVSLEHEVPWGPGWFGHCDIYDVTDAVVDEAFHSKELEFREVKALQNAGYLDRLEEITGRPHRGVLTAINATDVDRDGGFAIKRFPIEMDGPNGLRLKVREIRERVITAVEAGEVNPADKVSQTPHHAECRNCVFASLCHAGWTPPAPEDILGLEADFDALRIIESDLKHAGAKTDDLKRMRNDKRDAIREYLPAGTPVTSGNITIRRTEIAGRTSVKLGDYIKAGYSIPGELEPFVTRSAPSERWKIEGPS